MADRYWVGGTANWDATAGTKWALTSGGAGGQAVPTAADDVYFDAASGAVTCTISAVGFCRNLTTTGFTGTLTGGSTVRVDGFLTLNAGMTFTHTGTFQFTAASGSYAITTAGKTVGGISLAPLGLSTATWTLNDALTTSGQITVNYGTFNTNNFNVTATALSSNGSNTRTINLGSSTVTLSANTAIEFTNGTNLTFNAGTSTISCSGTNTQFNSSTTGATGQVFYNLSLTGTAQTSPQIYGANTFNNITVTAPAVAGVTSLIFSTRQTINGTLSTTGTAGNRRVWFRSTTYGIAQTLTINSAPNLTDADFRDLYVVGTAAPISGTRIGDLRGNSGITFSTPKTVYWNLAAGGNWSATAWAATSGGAVSTDNFPLAQDTAVIENTGLNTSATVTLDLAVAYIGTLTTATRSNAMAFAGSTLYTFYGNLTLSSAVTVNNNGGLTFSGRKTQTITSTGKNLQQAITVDSYGGTVELADAFNIGGANITVTNGTFDTKGYAVTAGGLSSSNSNVRTINLGSSTLTFNNNPISFNTNTNLTFNAGTSTINCSSFVGAFVGGSATTGVTFYDVSFTSTTPGSLSINGLNTFRNLSITAPSSSGLTLLLIQANQTINGTLTAAGASSIRRIFLRSDTLGTQRDLTVGTLAATDCDFRDIDILGAAAGSTPTRAGDCGGNAGITFPAPKTVYWNLAGTQNWSATGWAASSGGTPDINNFPLAQDTAVFDDTGSVTGTIQFNAGWNIGTFNASARTSAMTLNPSTNATAVYGNWLFGTGVTASSTTGSITFAGRGTQTITSNGVGFSTPITINGVTGTVQLADAFSLSSNRALTLTSGTFDAVSYNVTTGLFTDSGTIARTLRMGSGTWTLSGTGNIWAINNTTNFTFFKQTANIVLSDTSATARGFVGSGLSYNKLTIGGTTGTSTLTISGTNQFTELASTKTVAHTIGGTQGQTFGAWTITGTAGNVVTLSGTATFTIAGARVSGVDYLAMGTTTVSATSPGEFYAGANSTGVGAGVILTAAPAAVTRYWVGGTGTWNTTTTTNWSASSGGAGGASVPTSADAVVFDALSNATAYTVTCTATQLRCGSLTMAGPLTGNVTWAGTAPLAIHDNVSLAATGITRSYTGNITLTSSSTGKTLTTNGNQLASNISIDGVNCSWSLGSALDIGASSQVAVNNGSFDLATYNITASLIVSNTANTRTINFSSGTTTVSSAAPINFGTTDSVAANLTIIAGTSQINLTNAGTFSGNGKTFYNVSVTSASAFANFTINGVNTFNNLSVIGINSSNIRNVIFANDQTINGTLTISAPTQATRRNFLQSSTLGTTRTLTCAAVSATDADFRDIIIAGAAAPVSGTRLGDSKGNSGITFDAAKTVYWNLAGNNNWSATAWATSIGGTPAANNFPLAQDSAVFTSTSPATGATTTIEAAYNIGTIDMSARTTNTMTLATGSTTPFIYGNWINGTGTTLTGTGTLTFAGRGSQTITSAGRTFTQGFTINSPGGSVTLQDAFVSNRASTLAINLTDGAFNAATYNVTLSDASSGVNLVTGGTKTLGIGSGTWVIAGSGVSWSISGGTFTGTGTISFTSASAKTFNGGGISYSGITLNQGGAGALTIAGNNTFANITNTYKATGATSIALGTTTQRVGAFGASGEAGRVLTVTGTSATSPATLIFTGSGQATTPTTDYLTITGVKAYSLDTTWYAGANSTNNGSLGWYFVAGGGGAVTAFIIEASTAADSQSSLASFGVGISETITASEAQAAGLICLGTLSESATAADVAAAFQAYLGAVAESTTATDLIAASLTLNATISELTTGSEQVAATLSFSASVSELVAIADSLSGGLLFLSSISEATTAEEVVAASLVFNQVIAEAATVEDVLIAIAAFNAVVPESVSGSDVAQALLTVGGSINEALVALDESVVSLTISREVSESINSSDSYSSKFTAASYINEQSVVTFGPISVTTIRFDYEAIKDLYSRKRTVYVSRSSVSSERVVVVPTMNRTVYVPRESVSAERTGMVSVVDREVYVSGRSTSADRTTSVDE